MSTPYLGMIKPFSFVFAPKGWALCNGQFLSIQQNIALFSLLGTTYGGNGTTTFQLPNLQGSCAIMASGSSYVLGQIGGEAFHTLVPSEIPAHTHALLGSANTGTLSTPVGNYPAASTANPYYSTAPTTSAVTLGTGSSSAGSSQAHENRTPFLVVNFCIALTGIFPSRN